MSSLRETVARAINPAAWEDDLPVPTRAHTIAFHEGRAKSIAAADAAISAVIGAIQEKLDYLGSFGEQSEYDAGLDDAISSVEAMLTAFLEEQSPPAQ